MREGENVWKSYIKPAIQRRRERVPSRTQFYDHLRKTAGVLTLLFLIFSIFITFIRDMCIIRVDTRIVVSCRISRDVIDSCDFVDALELYIIYIVIYILFISYYCLF